MSKELQVGNDIFDYPTQGTNPGYGEDAAGWAEAVTNALANFLGPNDILLTTANLANNVTSPQVIPGLSFNTGDVQGINVDFLMVRTFNTGSTVITEYGKILGAYNGTDFEISVESAGTYTGIEIDITSGGQMTYTSTDLADHVSSLIYFKAATIDT